MSEEHEPVTEEEAILRRIHKRYYNPQEIIAVQPEAFRPTERDEDGLSVFRERFVSAAEVITAIAEEKRRLYYVARLAVRDLRGLNLTVLPAVQTGLPGHAIIPELNWTSYQKNRLRVKEWQTKLAELASQAIVYQPPPL